MAALSHQSFCNARRCDTHEDGEPRAVPVPACCWANRELQLVPALSIPPPAGTRARVSLQGSS